MLADISKQGYSVYLKPLDSGDLDFFNQVYGNPEIMQYIGKPLTRDQAKKQLDATIKTMSDANPHHLTYVIIRKSDRAKIGITGLTWFAQENRQKAAVGVMILAEFRRQKYAHNAKQLMMACGFEEFKLDVICAFCQLNNAAANKANMRLNMQKGRCIESGVHRKTTQEWLIEKTDWIGSISDQN